MPSQEQTSLFLSQPTNVSAQSKTDPQSGSNHLPDVDAANVVEHVPLQLPEGLGGALFVRVDRLHCLPLGQVRLVTSVEEFASHASLKKTRQNSCKLTAVQGDCLL